VATRCTNNLVFFTARSFRRSIAMTRGERHERAVPCRNLARERKFRTRGSSFPALEAYLRFRIIRFHFLNSLPRCKASGKNLNEDETRFAVLAFQKRNKHFPIHLAMRLFLSLSLSQSSQSFCHLDASPCERSPEEHVCVAALFMNRVVVRARLQFFVQGKAAMRNKRACKSKTKLASDIRVR